MQTGDTNYIYKNKLDKACSQHDMAYGKCKDLIKERKAFVFAKNPKYDGYQRGLVIVVYKAFDKKSKGRDIKENRLVANELHKPIIRKFKKKKVYSSFKDNIWDVDLADMQLISKYNKGIRYILFAIDLFSKYACVVPLKDKKELLMLMHFKVFWTIQKENQIRYGLMKVVNFSTLILKNG